jgi:NAD(P)-dependent dehydrogenase (short-subunit alcohol dehydrogenase family)
MDLKGKLVLITGASRGIGAAAARAFAGEGASVALLARSRDAIESLAAEIGTQACALPCDVADYAAVTEAVAQAEAQFGPCEVLINNAGVIEPISHLATSDPETWRDAVGINLFGCYHMVRAVLPGMVARQRGTILGISSGAANGPVEAWSHYCTAKAGAAMLTRMIDKENAGDGIRAIGLSPGTVATEMQREIKASGVNPVSQLDWSDHIPPDWPAKCLVWMCSAEADAYLGQDIRLRDPDLRARLGLA